MDLRTAEALSPQEYHARRTAERREECEARRLSVLRAARDAIRRLGPDHPAIRTVHIFGSVLVPGRFRADSDLDVAVACDTIEAETPFARALEDALHVPVDLRPLCGAVEEAVRESGERVYG